MTSPYSVIAGLPTYARIFLGSTVFASLGLLLTTDPAHAQPPPPPPWIPTAPLPFPGSFSYPYNIIAVPAPATTDARGVRMGAGVDPAAAADGLPGSKLGNSPNKPNILTSSSTRNGIAAGTVPAQTPNPGVNIGAGQENPALEDPNGKAPASATGVESSAPTTAPGGPGAPAPILESPTGKPATSTTPSPTPAPGAN
ncbi:hypothetical protein BOO86_24110 [Mycobacterium sp. CBMA 234]|uniref:hypothetical protein n=1 Tax=Mycolicibacterium sp. CBMA 234 TaxID=1918495 RepID=UPI001EE47BEF|nr:hypothetical protein [Mycolicibacterium sp. CBMA 234]MUL67577.1 hypothetical protein [Mycolicibacterium sp. CBMA 234]